MTSERYDEGGARDAVASEEILVSPDLGREGPASHKRLKHKAVLLCLQTGLDDNIPLAATMTIDGDN